MSDDRTDSYTLKAVLIAIGEMLLDARSVEAAYNAVAKMANVEGEIIKPWAEAKKENEGA